MSVQVLVRERFVPPPQDDRSSSRSAARLLACALTTLLISFVVVTRSADVLGPRTDSATQFAPGDVALVDDDKGHTLFDLPAMAPGRVEENCISVGYQGSIYPADVRLSATPTGALASHLDLIVEQGVGGGFGKCDGFEAEQALFTGTLEDFGARYGAARRGLKVFRALGPGDARTFRFRFAMQAEAPSGAQAATTFEWTARPA